MLRSGKVAGRLKWFSLSHKSYVLSFFFWEPLILSLELHTPHFGEFWWASMELIFHPWTRGRQCSFFAPHVMFAELGQEVICPVLWRSRLCPNLPIKIMAMESNSGLSFHTHLAAIGLNKAARSRAGWHSEPLPLVYAYPVGTEL